MQNTPSSAVKMANSYSFPLIGLGTFQIRDIADVKNAIKSAIKTGYRAIDTAAAYLNEKEIGIALKECFDEGLIKREELFVTSKIWMSDCKPEFVKIALKRSLTRLQLDYLDLYLIHWPVIYDLKKERDPTDLDNWFVKEAAPEEKRKYDTKTFQQVWKVMEECVEEGKIRSIGLANFSPKKLADILEIAKIKPSCMQMEIHPYNAQYQYVKDLQKMGLEVTAYQSLGGGESKIGTNGPLLENGVIKTIAEKHHTTVGQVLLKWAIQRGLHIIPKSRSADHIASNADLFSFELTNEDLESIKKLDNHQRICLGTFCVPADVNPSEHLWEE